MTAPDVLKPFADLAREYCCDDLPADTSLGVSVFAGDLQRAREAYEAAPDTVPDGWRCVPVVPTEEMLYAPLWRDRDVCVPTQAGKIHIHGRRYESRRDLRPDIYRAMLEAAPAAPAPAVPEGVTPLPDSQELFQTMVDEIERLRDALTECADAKMPGNARYIARAALNPVAVNSYPSRRQLVEALRRLIAIADAGHFRDGAQLSLAAHPAIDAARAALAQEPTP
jgi:hypothetical protein